MNFLILRRYGKNGFFAIPHFVDIRNGLPYYSSHMTSRERVQYALKHEEPDRVPIDNNGIVSSIHEVAYAGLLASLGLQEKPVILDAVQRITLNSEAVLTALGVDTRYVYPGAPSAWSYHENPDGTWTDEFGSTFRRVGFYADNVGPVLKDRSFAEVKAYKFPDPTDPARFKGMREQAMALHSSTSFAVVSGAMLSFDYVRWVFRGLEDAIADLHENPRLAEYQLDAIVDWMIAFGGGIMDQIGDLIEFFWAGDDWGAQGGPFYGPEMFRRYFKPRIARLIGAMKKKTRAKCAYHCCGSVRWTVLDAGIGKIAQRKQNQHGNRAKFKVFAGFARH
jgi:uroporphyrinogen decarboxylase